MSGRFVLAAALLAALCPSHSLWAARSELIPETMAAQHGLTRPWFTQVELDQSRGRLRDLILYEGTLYAQTDRAVVQAIDAETGRTLWSKQVGKPEHPSMTPAAYRDLLAVINGTRLYVLDRFNGELLHEKEISGSPGAGAALSARRAYVPLTSGLIVAYRLDPIVDAAKETEKSTKDSAAEERASSDANAHQSRRFRPSPAPPLFCHSFGRALVQPLLTRENANEEYVVWPTDRGYLNVGHIDRTKEDYLTLKYRLETGAPIVGRPAYLPPDPKVQGDSGLIIAASRDGFVHVIHEKTGQLLWRFSTGEPVIESPAVIEDRVYVSTQEGGMYCLAMKTGKELWLAPNAVQFVAASNARVYAVDRVGRLMVLNAENGTRLDTIAVESAPIKLLNTATDRIYLADDMGLVQCLHEVEQTAPVVHGKDRQQPEEEVAEPKEKPAAPKKTNDAAAATDPFAGDGGGAAGGKSSRAKKTAKSKKAKAAENP